MQPVVAVAAVVPAVGVPVQGGMNLIDILSSPISVAPKSPVAEKRNIALAAPVVRTVLARRGVQPVLVVT